LSAQAGSIGIFDSGYGGLTIFRQIAQLLPQYDYIYLGDNARAPYGDRSFDVIYLFSRQAVQLLNSRNCPLIILACNTASAKALRTLQQIDLPLLNHTQRILGVIRPTVEALPNLTHTNHVGLLATAGTIASLSYNLEAQRLCPNISLAAEPCPMWVPLVENNEHLAQGADYFVKKHLNNLLNADPLIDTIVLACTHYPLLIPKIQQHLPSPNITLFDQSPHIAQSLADYLQRHPDIEHRLARRQQRLFLTTDNPNSFNQSAARFLQHPLQAQHIRLD